MSHFIVKLTSGEAVYGILDEENTDSKMLTLKNPLVWEEYENSEGQVGSVLVKYIVGTDESEIAIATTGLVSMAAMSDQFAKYYDMAVECQKITDQSYAERLKHMTKKMANVIIEYQAKVLSDATDGLIAYRTDLDTIH